VLEGLYLILSFCNFNLAFSMIRINAYFPGAEIAPQSRRLVADELNDRGLSLGRAGIFSLCHHVQTGFETNSHPIYGCHCRAAGSEVRTCSRISINLHFDIE
jgi:hypothetical protein